MHRIIMIHKGCTPEANGISVSEAGHTFAGCETVTQLNLVRVDSKTRWILFSWSVYVFSTASRFTFFSADSRYDTAFKGWFPYDRKRSQTIADRRRSQRELFPYNRRRSQRIAEPTVAIHFVQQKCQMYSRVLLAGKSKQTRWRTSRRKFCYKQIYFFF